MANDKNKGVEALEKRMHEKIEEIDNKLASIKSDTHNMNRIFSLNYGPQIKTELKKIIKTSELRAVALYFTKEEIQANELASKLEVDPSNLSKTLNLFIDGGYLTISNRNDGRERYYKRAEIVDLIGYDKDVDFSKLVASWLSKHPQNQEK